MTALLPPSLRATTMVSSCSRPPVTSALTLTPIGHDDVTHGTTPTMTRRRDASDDSDGRALAPTFALRLALTHPHSRLDATT